MRKDKKKYEILVIEDNPGDFTLIEDYLREQVTSPQITHAQKFSEAKSLLNPHKTNYDVILLDLSLPDKSGETLITEINSLCSGCPVIVLTGYEDIEFSIKSLSLGVADYLVKDDINAPSLYKSIVYNIERKKTNIKLKESEKRYSNLFHLSPQPMWVYEPETFRFVQVNKAAMEHYGYNEEEFFNMTIMDIMPEEDVMKVKELLNKKDEKKEIHFDGRFRHCRKSKEIIEVEIFSNPIMINDKVYCSVIAIDVTEKILFEHNLTRAIIKTQEDERYEIGGELHDNVCQILATSQINLEMLKKSLAPSVMQWFDRCKEYIILASEEIRNLSHRLAPAFFDDTTLHDTFMTLLNSFNIGNRYKISLHFDAAVQGYPLNRDILLNLYRILQEQLRNISKYANATKLKVEVLIHNNKLEMRVSDNGVGFDVKNVKGGIGLANMKRRAELFSGKIEIDASPGNGCEITIEIPLEAINSDSLFEPFDEMANYKANLLIKTA